MNDINNRKRILQLLAYAQLSVKLGDELKGANRSDLDEYEKKLDDLSLLNQIIKEFYDSNPGE